MKKILALVILIFITLNTYSQQTGTMVPASQVANAKDLIEAYISPLGNSLAAGLNNGWYNTAKPHKLGGFDLTFTANFVLINDEVKTFKIDDVVEGNFFSGESTPTILGSSDANADVDIEGGTTVFKMPNGLDIPTIPVPVLQVGIGLIKGTEIDIRYVPETKFGKAGQVSVLGFGIKHDLLQWLPIVDKIPVDLAIQAGYTKVDTDIELIDANGYISPGIANLDLSATTVNLILSKKLLMFTPYVGVGYNSNTTVFNVENKFHIGNQWIPVADLKEYEFSSNNNFRTNIGFRFNIAVIALQANYTFSEYPTATLGIGISVR
jgi:hypothetical protein